MTKPLSLSMTIDALGLAALLAGVMCALSVDARADAEAPEFLECKEFEWVPRSFRNQGECVSTLATGGMIWHLPDDFVLSPDQANPNPDSNGNDAVWWFLYNPVGLDPNPDNYVLLPYFTVVDANREQWDDGLPFPVPYPEVGLVKNLGALIVHPDYNQLVVIGWRSPIDGVVRIRGGFLHIGGDGNGVRWFIDHDDGFALETLASGVLDVGEREDFGLDLTADVNLGDYLYFSVDPRPDVGPGDADFDSTLMRVTISGPIPPTN